MLGVRGLGYILDLYIGNNGKENGNYYSMLGFFMGNMETTLVCWGYIVLFFSKLTSGW